MKKPEKLWIKYYKGIIVIDPLQVQFISGNKEYCTVYISSDSEGEFEKNIINRKIETRQTLKFFENILKYFGFIRCHRNFLINPQIVDKYCINESAINFSENFVIPVSKRKKKYVYDLYFYLSVNSNER